MILRKYCLFLLTIFISIGCRTVEMSVPSQEIKLLVRSDRKTNPSVYLSEGAGSFKKLKSDSKNIYNFRSPSMDGGYRSFLFFKYNIHNPNEYEIIRIKENERIIKELSLKDINELTKNESGYSVLEMK